MAARVEKDAAHDAVADFEPGGGGADCHNSAATLVRGGQGQLVDAEDAFDDHAVGVAVGGDGDFDNQVMGADDGGHRHGVDMVGFAEGDDLDGLHRGREGHGGGGERTVEGVVRRAC